MTFHPEPLDGAVRRELTRLGPPAAIGGVVAVWQDAVGAQIASNAWPARLGRDGTLTVTASSSAWAFELTQLEGTIRARLSERLASDAPAKLKFIVGAVPESGDESENDLRRDALPIGPAERARGEEIAAAIDDSELRALVARAAAASLARAERDRPL